MLPFIAMLQSSGLHQLHLNTSHVIFYRFVFRCEWASFLHLNTSHVIFYQRLEFLSFKFF